MSSKATLKYLFQLFGLIALVTGFTSSPAAACQMEIGNSYYSVYPLKDDGLSNAERVDCALGKMSFYTETKGWQPMRDEKGASMVLQDLRGAYIFDRNLEFFVAVLKDNRVAFRFGDAGGGKFFANDQFHSTWIAQDNKRQPLNGLRVDEVTYKGGKIMVGVKTNSQEYCEITSDERLNFGFDWKCVRVP